MRFCAVLSAALFALACAPVAEVEPEPEVEEVAPTQPPEGAVAEYTLRIPDAHTHYLEVEARIDAADQPTVELMMAVWTPGSYLVREFSRHVEGVHAFGDSGPLPVDKTRKNRWAITNDGSSAITVRYRVYCRELSVQTNWVDADFASLNGAPTFLVPVGGLDRPHDVRVELPDGWASALTAMPRHPSGEPHHFRAPDYDTLVDSPWVLGNPAVHEFEVDGVPHKLVNQGEDEIWDGPKSAEDVETIVRTQVDFWGEIPYPQYLFLNVIEESRGGLEHKDSTLMLTSRWRSRSPDGYRRWLGLVSHEFFHTWNVKRMRPATLGPFDYENEVYTPSLWIAEGFTSYYDDLMLLRGGLLTRSQYLQRLSDQIGKIQTTPGRLVRPLSRTSYDAWIKHYRSDENSKNTTISYYRKGSVVAFLLDAEIRRRTSGARSLDDAMRLAWTRFSGERGYTPEAFRATVGEVAGADLSDWFARAVDSTDELEYDAALAWYGLRFKPPKDTAEADEDSPPAWLGLVVRSRDGSPVVSGVRRDTPGYDAGFNVDDEILAVDAYRVSGDGWSSRLAQYEPGDEAEILIARREKLRTIRVVFGEEPDTSWTLQIDPTATPSATRHLDDWLGPDTE